MQRLGLWIAQGFGIGRIPFAPGTFGSLLGLIWFIALLETQRLWLFVAGLLLGGAASVWLCQMGEKALGRKDPGSVVLDEITALPVCFLPWLLKLWLPHHLLPPLSSFFGPGRWYWTGLIFILFRVFDVTKPGPIRASQSLPGGWGVTIDDFLAAVAVALVTLPLLRFMTSAG
jgi:phosphatidylglycerophosphatase A